MTFSNESGLRTLIEMLAWRRPAGSKTERKFIREDIQPLGVQADTYGNRYKRIGTAPVAWLCHTDSVHRFGGVQRVALANCTATVGDKESNCLGADDAVGVWLMREMIRADVPGLYVFHRAEEIGGLGSQHIAGTTPGLLAGIQFAVSLDRKGKDSVITHQGGQRTCSDMFADSLARALGESVAYRRDNGGVFTDSANYADIVGECSNLSVGYKGEHTRHESLDLTHAAILRDALCELDAGELVSSRKPGAAEWLDYGLPYGAPHGHGATRYDSQAWDVWGDVDQTPRGKRSMLALVQDYPAEIADWLEQYNVDPTEIEEAIRERGGFIRRR